MGTQPASAPQIFHFTLFFDAENSTPDNVGLFSFSSVVVGTEAVTTFQSPTGPFNWPFVDFNSVPEGSTLFFSFVENSGNIVTAGPNAPACWIKPIMGPPPVTPALPTKDAQQPFSLTSPGDGEPPLIGTMGSFGFVLGAPGTTWSMKVVVRVMLQGSDVPRIFRSPVSLIVLGPPPPPVPGQPPTDGDFFDSDVDTSGG